jgi:hypothetical protein
MIIGRGTKTDIFAQGKLTKNDIKKGQPYKVGLGLLRII